MTTSALYQWIGHAFSRRFVLVVAGVLSCVYSLYILATVPFLPDLGLRTLFNPTLRGIARGFHPLGDHVPEVGDTVLKVGDISIRAWPDLIKAPSDLQKEDVDIGVRVGWRRLSDDGRSTLIR